MCVCLCFISPIDKGQLTIVETNCDEFTASFCLNVCVYHKIALLPNHVPLPPPPPPPPLPMVWCIHNGTQNGAGIWSGWAWLQVESKLGSVQRMIGLFCWACRQGRRVCFSSDFQTHIVRNIQHACYMYTNTHTIYIYLLHLYNTCVHK